MICLPASLGKRFVRISVDIMPSGPRLTTSSATVPPYPTPIIAVRRPPKMVTSATPAIMLMMMTFFLVFGSQPVGGSVDVGVKKDDPGP